MLFRSKRLIGEMECKVRRLNRARGSRTFTCPHERVRKALRLDVDNVSRTANRSKSRSGFLARPDEDAVGQAINYRVRPVGGQEGPSDTPQDVRTRCFTDGFRSRLTYSDKMTSWPWADSLLAGYPAGGIGINQHCGVARGLNNSRWIFAILFVVLRIP